jgi:RimJ/RimL family protein N-acetyltransferase
MPSYSQIRLRTARLDLRPLAHGDEGSLFAIYSDPDFMRYWSSPPWTSIQKAIDLIQSDTREMASGEHIRLGVFNREDSRLIGTCSLFKIDEQCRRAEIGYGIAKDAWRMGFMTEAVTAVIEYAFVEMRLNRLEADIDPRNVASGSSLEKLGFLRDGYLRERWIVGEEVSDSALYGLLSREWRNRRASAA